MEIDAELQKSRETYRGVEGVKNFEQEIITRTI